MLSEGTVSLSIRVVRRMTATGRVTASPAPPSRIPDIVIGHDDRPLVILGTHMVAVPFKTKINEANRNIVLPRATRAALKTFHSSGFHAELVRSDTTPMPTGLRTDTIRFASLPNIPFRLRCPACKKLHKWRPKDAWVRKDDN
jgi:hypothetical protein